MEGKRPMNNSLENEVVALAHLLWHSRVSPGDAVYGIGMVDRHLWNEQQKTFSSVILMNKQQGSFEAERFTQFFLSETNT